MSPQTPLARHRILAVTLIIAAAIMGYFLGGESVHSSAPHEITVVQQH